MDSIFFLVWRKQLCSDIEKNATKKRDEKKRMHSVDLCCAKNLCVYVVFCVCTFVRVRWEEGRTKALKKPENGSLIKRERKRKYYLLFATPFMYQKKKKRAWRIFASGLFFCGHLHLIYFLCLKILTKKKNNNNSTKKRDRNRTGERLRSRSTKQKNNRKRFVCWSVFPWV